MPAALASAACDPGQAAAAHPGRVPFCCPSSPARPAAATSKELRQSTLEALGYCCEELGNLDEDYLSQQVCNTLICTPMCCSFVVLLCAPGHLDEDYLSQQVCKR